MRTTSKLLTGMIVAAVAGGAAAEDWPEVQGKGRRGVWNETGILETFPAGGLDIRWRTPIHGGYAGPAVADGRVFVSDFKPKQVRRGAERVICLDEKTGRILWTFQDGTTNYAWLGYASGPRATPTVDGDRVYALGAVGNLYCLDVKTGKKIWSRDFREEFGAKLPIWGFAGAPLVCGDLLICLAGARPTGKVMALNKMTGKVVWRALPGDNALGYAPPVLIEAGGAEQLIQWHGGGVTSLDPKTGKVHWRQPFKLRMALSISTPQLDNDRLFLTTFYNGPMMLRLAGDRPAAEVTWRGKSESERQTDGLHAITCTPAIWKGHIYGVCSYGQFRCLDAKTGKRIWETLKLTGEESRWASAFLTRNGDRFFINNDSGELIIADLSPKGYREISRTKLIEPTTVAGGKNRTLGAVNWTLPAYANRCIFIRNDKEILCASLATPK